MMEQQKFMKLFTVIWFYSIIGTMSKGQFEVKLPHVEGISAEVLMGTLPTIDELIELDGMMPLIIVSEMPDPIVATKVMVGVRPFDGHDGVPLIGVRFLGNIDLSDTQEVEDGMDALLHQGLDDGPPIESDIDKAIRQQVNKSDTSIILSSSSVIGSEETKLPKKDLCAFTSKVFATSLTIIRNRNITTGDPSSAKSSHLGSFVLSAT